MQKQENTLVNVSKYRIKKKEEQRWSRVLKWTREEAGRIGLLKHSKRRTHPGQVTGP